MSKVEKINNSDITISRLEAAEGQQVSLTVFRPVKFSYTFKGTLTKVNDFQWQVTGNFERVEMFGFWDVIYISDNVIHVEG